MLFQEGHGFAADVRLDQKRPERIRKPGAFVEFLKWLFRDLGEQPNRLFQFFYIFPNEINVERRAVVGKKFSFRVEHHAPGALHEAVGDPVVFGKGSEFFALDHLKVPESDEQAEKNEAETDAENENTPLEPVTLCGI